MDADHESSVSGAPDTLSAPREKALAVELYNKVWSLLESPGLSHSPDEVVHCAHASAWHWPRTGTTQNRAISEWQVARVYSVLGRAEPALHHARRAVELAEQVGDVPWLAASAYEGMARACPTAGDVGSARQWRERAVAALDGVDDAEDREVVERDIASLRSMD